MQDCRWYVLLTQGVKQMSLALMVARLHTGNHSMISLRNAYHGGSANTLGLTALRTWNNTMPEGIGNGLPLGAVVTTQEIASALTQKIQFNPFGGNPVCSAGGLAVLRVLGKEKRQAHCADVGAHLIGRLRSLQEKHDIIGDVRGRGLMMEVEFVTDRKEKTPAKAETNFLFETLRELGVLVEKGGMHANIFRIKPIMCFTKYDADALDYALSKL